MKKFSMLVLMVLFVATNSLAEESVLFSKGAKTSKWGALGIVQSKLGIKKDGDFGKNTEQAVRQFQINQNLPSTGQIDTVTWKTLTGLNQPTVEERAKELTFALEGTDFDRWEWNYPYDERDRSGATWGPAGLTIYDNEIQEVFKRIEQSDPNMLSSVFGNLYPIVKELTQKKGKEAKQYLKQQVYDIPSKRENWVKHIIELVDYDKARQVYTEFSKDNFAPKMKALHKAYPVETELDYAFYWDISVHTSGVNDKGRKARIDQRFASQPPTKPSEKRKIIGDIFTETLGNQYQKQSRHERNALFVNGKGVVHGTRRDCTVYGLADRPYQYQE